MQPLRIATRGSKLALWQANHIKSLLQTRHEGLEVELVIIKTTGDIIQDVPLAKVGGKGLFTKEIEEALLEGRADLAVHSMKDVPAVLPAGLFMGVIPDREDPTDTLLSVTYTDLDSLPQGAVVGTSSLRRQAQLLMLRPDLDIQTLRGNVDTRLRKLREGLFVAIVMATAGIRRLELDVPNSFPLGPPQFLPAVGQGALGIELREDRQDVYELLQFMDSPETRITVTAERGFLTTLEGGCQVPIAGHAVLTDQQTVRLTGLVAGVRGETSIRKEAEGPADTAWELGCSLANQMLDAGGREILECVYGKKLG